MPNAPDTSSARKIFVTSSLILFTAGLSFALRGAVLGAIESELLAKLDPARASELAGELGGTAFWSFAFALLGASTFLERIGMGRGVVVAGLAFALGTGIAIASPALAEGWAAYHGLRLGFLLSGLGWGFMEATVNPLTTALYPNDKVARLNILHAWWPAGIVVGGASAPALASLGLGWQAQLALVAPPALVACALCVGTRFPTTERAAAGVRFGEMFVELRRHPMFALWFACMFLTAASELAPGQWIDLTLTRTVGMRGIWLLVYVSGMMFVLRHFAGAIAHRIAPIGMLLASVAIATVGLLLLPRATTPIEGLGAATVWGLGVCFLWPTMLANVSERYPRGGELFIGLMGFAGALSIAFVLPMLGRSFDDARSALAGGEAAFAALAPAQQAEVLRAAATTSFETLAWFPAVLVLVFGAIALADRARRARALNVALVIAVALASSACGRDAGAPTRGRVLVVGLDGATQKVIAPLASAGELPTFAALARDGTTGAIRAGLPILSPRIWTSAATGVEPEQHGILDWVRKGRDGELRLYSNLDRRAPAIWNIASEAGLRVGVVNWLITQPPDVVNGVMISDHAIPGMTASRLPMAKEIAAQRFGAAQAQGEVGAPEAAIAYASPDEWVERAAALRAVAVPLTNVPDPFTGPAWQGHAVFDFLRGVYRDDELTVRTALAVEADLHPDLMLVYLPGIDRVSHLLWQGIEVPDDPPRELRIHPPSLRAEHRRALHAYYRFSDALLAKLLERYSSDDLVVVLSDHGFEASRNPHTMPGVHESDDARDGILLLRGRGVAAGARAPRIAHVDLVPTLLAWLGLPLADDLPGTPAPFVTGAPSRTGNVASYRDVRVERVAAPASDADAEILEKLRTLGYVE